MGSVSIALTRVIYAVHVVFVGEIGGFLGKLWGFTDPLLSCSLSTLAVRVMGALLTVRRISGYHNRFLHPL